MSSSRWVLENMWTKTLCYFALVPHPLSIQVGGNAFEGCAFGLARRFIKASSVNTNSAVVDEWMTSSVVARKIFFFCYPPSNINIYVYGVCICDVLIKDAVNGCQVVWVFVCCLMLVCGTCGNCFTLAAVVFNVWFKWEVDWVWTIWLFVLCSYIIAHVLICNSLFRKKTKQIRIVFFIPNRTNDFY